MSQLSVEEAKMCRIIHTRKCYLRANVRVKKGGGGALLRSAYFIYFIHGVELKPTEYRGYLFLNRM